MSDATTKTNATTEWAICDEVIRLREWGTERIHRLPTSLIETALIGSSQECSLRLDDPHVSRKHAKLTFERGKWLIRDLGSTNGLRQATPVATNSRSIRASRSASAIQP